MYKLMVIEDDIQLNNLIQESLKRYGYTVYSPENFRNIENEFIKYSPDLVLLDVNLPYFDGFYLSKVFRKQSNVPIIIISARSEETDQIMAIEFGADDYITKPFTFELLHTKIKATIRRVYGEYSVTNTEEICIGPLRLNKKTFDLTYDGEKVELSKNEYRLLKKLMENHGHFVAREELIEEVWDSITFIDDNTLTVNMSRIKQIFTNLGFNNTIKSKRGVGYSLQIPILTENE